MCVSWCTTAIAYKREPWGKWHKFLMGRMPFRSPNQWFQSTDRNSNEWSWTVKITHLPHPFFIRNGLLWEGVAVPFCQEMRKIGQWFILSFDVLHVEHSPGTTKFPDIPPTLHNTPTPAVLLLSFIRYCPCYQCTKKSLRILQNVHGEVISSKILTKAT